MSVKLEKDALAVYPEGVSVEGNIKVLQGEYDVPVDFPEPPVVLDIGGHIGAFSKWAMARWPGAIVFAYEPHPELFKALRLNLGDEVVCRKCAVSDADGTAPLFEGATNLGASSLKKTTGEVKNAGGVVKLVHASKLPKCDVLKIDTEGSELDILRNYKHLGQCKAVVLEWHSQRDREDIRELMAPLGFRIVEDSSWAPERGNLKFVRDVRPHLFVAILAGGGKLFYENELCVAGLRQLAPKAGYDVTVSYDPGTGVDRARNRQVARFLESGATHLLMLDNDLAFQPNDVTRMIASNLDFVAGAYPRKQIEWAQVHAAVKAGVEADKLHEWSCSFIYNTVVNNEGGNNAVSLEGLGDFVEIEEVGTGFMLIKRSVIEKMIKAYGDEMAYVTDYEPRGQVHHTVFACWQDPKCEREQAKAELLKVAAEATGPQHLDKLYDACSRYRAALKDNGSLGRYLTEDYRMCRLWRMLGGKIYLLTDCDLDHIGGMTFTGRIRHFLRKAEEAPSTSDPKQDQSGDRNS